MAYTRNIIFLLGAILLPLVFIRLASALENTITLDRYVIDEQAKTKDIFEYKIKIKNHSSTTRASVYAIVNDIAADNGRQEITNPHQLDKTASLSSWIEIRRALIEIKPNQEIVEPLTVKVNMNAVPGRRHAEIAFVQARDGYEAESLATQFYWPKIILNFEVENLNVEKAQLISFQTVKNLYFKQPVVFQGKVKNVGNLEIIPAGYIRIYDRRGAEVEAIELNQGRAKIAGGADYEFSPSWTTNMGFGKYKARLEFNYGDLGQKDLQDVIYFWILPWKIISGFGALVAMLCLLLFIMKKRKKRKTAKITKPVKQAV